MLTRATSLLLAAIFALASAHGAVAADQNGKTTPSANAKNLFGRCGYLNNVFIFGDPVDCPNDETVPACDDAKVLRAALKFANKAETIYRRPRVRKLLPVREARDTVFNPSPIDRRYCIGTAELDNEHVATAHYFVEEDGGPFGLSWTVYVCLTGYDDWRVYDGRCRVAKAPPAH